MSLIKNSNYKYTFLKKSQTSKFNKVYISSDDHVLSNR